MGNVKLRLQYESGEPKLLAMGEKEEKGSFIFYFLLWVAAKFGTVLKGRSGSGRDKTQDNFRTDIGFTGVLVNRTASRTN